MNNYRKILALGLNEALKQGLVSLDIPHNPDNKEVKDSGHAFIEIAGYPSVFLWQDIGFGELRISVWWNYDHSKHPQAYPDRPDEPNEFVASNKENFRTSRPLARKTMYHKFVGAVVSGWLERKEGQYIQGNGKDDLFDLYLRKDMQQTLKNIPAPQPSKYSLEGKFYYK